MYERGDSNPHALKALDPKSSASTNSATLASAQLISNYPDFESLEKYGFFLLISTLIILNFLFSVL